MHTICRQAFRFSEPEPLLTTIFAQLEVENFGWADVIAIHVDAYLMAVELVRQVSYHQKRQECVAHELRTCEPPDFLFSLFAVFMPQIFFLARVYEPCETLDGLTPSSIILQMTIAQQPSAKTSQKVATPNEATSGDV